MKTLLFPQIILLIAYLFSWASLNCYVVFFSTIAYLCLCPVLFFWILERLDERTRTKVNRFLDKL